MFRKKTRQRLKHLFALALASLILNLSFPTLHPIEAQAAQPAKVKTSTSIAPAAVETVQAQTAQLPVVKDKPAKRRMVVRASAYSSTVDQTDGDPFTAASGAKVHDGMIAMNGMPFGTKIRIPQYYGNKVFVVEDRMNARWGNRKIDIWMTTRAAAMQWGVRTLTIEIL
jgi:3D (Asp-Asp-Asp) domain-containing protein